MIPVQSIFPNFDDTLRQGLRRETELFFASVLRENRSVLDLLDASYTFVNERVAEHYGLPNVKGSRFRRVDLPPGSPRRGIFGQGAILAVTSFADRTSPVKRGHWILGNLLGAEPPPPPPNVPPLELGDPIDASGVLPDGSSFRNLEEFRAALESSELFRLALAEKLMYELQWLAFRADLTRVVTFMLGRELNAFIRYPDTAAHLRELMAAKGLPVPPVVWDGPGGNTAASTAR